MCSLKTKESLEKAPLFFDADDRARHADNTPQYLMQGQRQPGLWAPERSPEILSLLGVEQQGCKTLPMMHCVAKLLLTPRCSANE